MIACRSCRTELDGWYSHVTVFDPVTAPLRNSEHLYVETEAVDTLHRDAHAPAHRETLASIADVVEHDDVPAVRGRGDLPRRAWRTSVEHDNQLRGVVARVEKREDACHARADAADLVEGRNDDRQVNGGGCGGDATF